MGKNNRQRRKQKQQKKVKPTSRDNSTSTVNPVDLFRRQFEAASGKAGLFELDLRLLVNRTPQLERVAFESFISTIVPKVIDHFRLSLSDEEVQTLTIAKDLRNKILHAEMQDIADKTEAGNAGVQMFDGVPTEGPEILNYIQDMAAGKIQGKTVRHHSARDVGVFGWLLENGSNGSFVRAYSLFERAIKIVNRLCFVLDGVETPSRQELPPQTAEEKPVDPFIEYAHLTYPRAIEQLQISLRQTDFEIFHALTIKFLFVVEKDSGHVAAGAENDHKRQVLSKMCQELMAFVWCLNGGSLHGCFHHLRSIMEITATANYFFAGGKAAKQQKRVKKYYEFKELSKYQLYHRLKIKLDDGKITQEEFDNECIIMPKDIESFTEERIQGWQDLWEPDSKDVLDIKNWHFPANIDNLVDNAEPEYRSIYHNICHVVHVSPMGKGLAGQNLVLQKNEVYRAKEYVQLASNIFHKFLRILDDWTGEDYSTKFVPIYMQFGHLKHLVAVDDADPKGAS